MPDASPHPLKEGKKGRERDEEREGVTERDIGRDEVCVIISLRKGSQRRREQKEWMWRGERRKKMVKCKTTGIR